MIHGNIYRIMIGCPSDIKEEVQIAKNVILKWTCINAETYNMVLLPLHWGDDAYPDYGSHPQKMLDKQLVDRSDLLICIFGCKIGTATDTADSGSIEEIEEHVKAGKHVMVFFKKSNNIYSVETDQLQKLRDFRDRIKGKSMWWEYDDANQFESILQQKLTLFLNANWLQDAKVQGKVSPSIEEFTHEEKMIFSRWANNPINQTYHHTNFCGRTEIHLGYRFGITLKDGKDTAWWEDLLERWVSLNYVKLDRYDKYNHPTYKITMKGYEYAKTLNEDELRERISKHPN